MHSFTSKLSLIFCPQQRYVCHELAYQTHKFDLRIYFLIASVDPLVVLYHDGSLRVALSQYNDHKFGSTAEHLTNIARNQNIDNCTATFDAWDVALREHVAQAPSGQFTATVAADPLGHIRNQIKAALADMVAASRDKAFHGYRDKTKMEVGSVDGGRFPPPVVSFTNSPLLCCLPPSLLRMVSL